MVGLEQPQIPALPNEENRPSISELHGGHPLAQAAQRLWLSKPDDASTTTTKNKKKGAKKEKFNPNVVKTEFWDVLEKEGFRYRSLLLLENLQFLEKYVPRLGKEVQLE